MGTLSLTWIQDHLSPEKGDLSNLFCEQRIQCCAFGSSVEAIVDHSGKCELQLAQLISVVFGFLPSTVLERHHTTRCSDTVNQMRSLGAQPPRLRYDSIPI
jgi:hypothetical protein